MAIKRGRKKRIWMAYLIGFTFQGEAKGNQTSSLSHQWQPRVPDGPWLQPPWPEAFHLEQKLHNFVVSNGVHRECTPKLQWDLFHFVPALQIYDRYKADDGFLYIAYSAENTLGWETGTVDLWLCRLTSRWRWPNRRHVQKTLGVLGTSPTLLDFKHIHENILDVQWSTGIIQNRKLPYWR